MFLKYSSQTHTKRIARLHTVKNSGQSFSWQFSSTSSHFSWIQKKFSFTNSRVRLVNKIKHRMKYEITLTRQTLLVNFLWYCILTLIKSTRHRSMWCIKHNLPCKLKFEWYVRSKIHKSRPIHLDDRMFVMSPRVTMFILRTISVTTALCKLVLCSAL